MAFSLRAASQPGKNNRDDRRQKGSGAAGATKLPCTRKRVRRKVQWFGSGSFFNTAQTNASRTDTYLLADTVNDRADALQVGIPAAAPGIVSVADHVSVMRPFAADCTLQCHDSTLPTLQRIENRSFNCNRANRENEVFLVRI